MRKRISILIVVLLISSMLSFPAMASGSQSYDGFYNIGTADGITITPGAEDVATIVSVVNCDIDGDGVVDTWYQNSDYMKVSYNMAVEDGYYGLIMVKGKDALPTVDNTIFYVDQITAESNVVDFDVYPLLPEETTDLTIYITSDVEGHELVRILLSYAVDAEAGDAPDFVIGDVNGDTEVDFADAIAVLKHDAGVLTLTGDKLSAADTNGDDEVDFVDAMQILKYDCGLISSFR